MSRGLEDKHVKSAQRVLEVLEYFSDDRPDATVMDISRALRYPQSSMSELLSCLVNMGYLARDRARRTYRPTARVAVIGLRVQPALFRRGAIFSLMDELHESTGAVAVLSLIQRCRLHHVHVVGSEMPIGQYQSYSPLHSPLGQVLISTFDPAQVRGLLHRLNSESDDTNIVRLSEFTKTLEQIRARGAAVGLAGAPWPGTMVSVRLPTAAGDALALGLVDSSIDPADDVEINKLLRTLRGEINRQIGPTAVERVATAALSRAG